MPDDHQASDKNRNIESFILTPAVLNGPSGGQSSGTVRIHFWSTGARVWRAVKAMGLCWLAAVFTVLVPFAHWVLVPSLLLAGPIVAAAVYGRQRKILGGEATCPDCQTPLTILPGVHQAAFYQLCPGCRNFVRIDPQR